MMTTDPRGTPVSPQDAASLERSDAAAIATSERAALAARREVVRDCVRKSRAAAAVTMFQRRAL